MTNNIGVQFPGWVDHINQFTTVDINNSMSMNEIFRHSEPISPETTFESGFIYWLTVHNIYIHCPNLGHYSTIGVRGESTIIKTIPVSSSFGYLIIDSAVAPHDKIDVSMQSLKTMHTLKNVHGNVMNLHGAHVSLSLIFQTIEYLFNFETILSKEYINSQKMVEESREQIEEIINNEEPMKKLMKKLIQKLKKKPYKKYFINLKLIKQKVRLNQILKLRKNQYNQLKKKQKLKQNRLKKHTKTNC